MTSCFKCNDPIIFDESWVSERSGKKIPLDEYTHEPHKCAAYNFTSQVLQCQYCEQEIAFDNEHVSRNGKRIPLNPETMEPHSCEEGLEVLKQKQKNLTCKYCLEVELTFDDDQMTNSGKHVQLEVSTCQPHKCPRRQHNPNTGRTTTVNGISR
jgi:hypothetical protein